VVHHAWREAGGGRSCAVVPSVSREDSSTWRRNDSPGTATGEGGRQAVGQGTAVRRPRGGRASCGADVRGEGVSGEKRGTRSRAGVNHVVGSPPGGQRRRGRWPVCHSYLDESPLSPSPAVPSGIMGPGKPRSSREPCTDRSSLLCCPHDSGQMCPHFTEEETGHRAAGGRRAGSGWGAVLPS
jgi:hypothetical protein